MKKVKLLLFFTAGILVGFTSCSPCKRMHRLTARHPECLQSITVTDTVRIPGTKADTIFSRNTVKDTVILQKDRLTVKYFQSQDTVFLSGECRDSVIIRHVPVRFPIAAKERYPWWVWVLAGVALGFVGLALMRR
jgi:hypothetical protein